MTQKSKTMYNVIRFGVLSWFPHGFWDYFSIMISSYSYMLQWRTKLFHLLKCEKKFQAFNFKNSSISLPSASHSALQEATRRKSLISSLSLAVTRELVSHLFLLSPRFFILVYVQYFQKNLLDSTCVCNHCIKKA